MAEVYSSRRPPAWVPNDNVEISYGWRVDDQSGEVRAFVVEENTSPDAFRFEIDGQAFVVMPGSGRRRVTLDTPLTATFDAVRGRWKVNPGRMVTERIFAEARRGSPAVLSVTETVVSTAGTTHNLAMPATVNANDGLLVAWGYAPDPQAAVTMSMSGFTLKRDFQQGGDENGVSVFIKVATGSEDGTSVNLASSGNAIGIGYVYRIQAGTWAELTTGVEASAGTSGESGAPDPPNLAPSWGSLDTLWIALASVFNDGPAITGAPSGYTDFSGNEASATEDVSVGTARRTNTASSEDPGGFAADGGDEWAAVTIAVAPVLVSVEWDQEGYRWRNDDGSETTATWKEDQDTPATLGVEEAARLRVLMDAVDDPGSVPMTLQYKRSDEADSEWRNV